MISRRTFATGLGTSLLPLGSLSAQEVDWPTKPVRVIVPYVAGGIVDVLTRKITGQLADMMGQAFVVENRVGASGNLGMGVAARAAPDGYTLTSTSSSAMTTNEHVYNNLPYNPERDFSIASIFWENTNCLFVAAGHPAKTVAEFVAWAKKKPEGTKYGSSGIGTATHLAAEIFKGHTGIEARHVPYPGAPQCALAVMAGDLDFTIDNIGPYLGLMQSGQIRGLAVTAEERWPRLPDVPTMAQAGVPDSVIMTWACLAFPTGVPAGITLKLSKAVASVTADPSIQSTFLDTGAKAISIGPERAMEIAATERKKWGQVLAAAGIKPQ